MGNWEQNVRRVTPYVPGEQPKQENIIKLNTNENPYPPSPALKKAWQQMDLEKMRLYPDPAASELVTAIAETYGVKESQVFAGVGSDDVLAMAFLTFFNSERPILFPDITYSFYDVWAELFRIPYRQIPLNDRFEIIKEDYFAENGGIVFPNPNAPTGVELPVSDIEAIIAANQNTVVIVDEAYVDFGTISVLPLIEKYDNLLVVQTFSKSRSLAGLRIGYAFGSEKLIKYLNDAKYSFNSYTMSRPSVLMGAAVVRDQEYFTETIHKIISTRERMKKELAGLGFVFADSKSNFLFVTHPQYSAKELFAQLKEAGIFVRYFEKPRIDRYLRITVGTDEEMDCLLNFLKEKCTGVFL
ncbi:MAG: histidinol-phosphate transaminase [Eubacterium sp.]|nr:histidinol-phosphate transaminase [Eubacterium sp.]